MITRGGGPAGAATDGDDETNEQKLTSRGCAALTRIVAHGFILIEAEGLPFAASCWAKGESA
jgi:hypothetical protein